jgi:restriction system protein
LSLTSEEIAETVPSGTQTRFANRTAWAHIYLKRAGLLASDRRGIYRIAPRGEEVLQSPPEELNMQFLERYPEYREFRAKQSSTENAASPEASSEAAAVYGQFSD